MMPFNQSDLRHSDVPRREGIYLSGKVHSAGPDDLLVASLEKRTRNPKDIWAQFELGMWHFFGNEEIQPPRQPNTEKACEYLERASLGGHVLATLLLYRIATGQQATSALWRLAEQGNAEAREFCKWQAPESLEEEFPFLH